METEACLGRGQIECVDSSQPNFSYERYDGSAHQIDVPEADRKNIFHLIFTTLLDSGKGVLGALDDISAVGHRVVHGGSFFSESEVITPPVELAIQKCIPLAPLHNPYNLQGIRVCRELLPTVPHVAVFDTAFHQTMPDYTYVYPLPYRLHQEYGIRRYGFHGISHRYVSKRAAEIMETPLDTLKLISCHLGNGCSVTAIDGCKSLDTSMGFTPLEGLMMGTRCGDIDPAIVFHLYDHYGLSIREINQMLNRESGLLGVSGVSADMRDLFPAVFEGNQQASLAVKMFCYRASQYIGSYVATLGCLDVLIFTAGIGENVPQIRAEICAKLGFMGIHLDEEENREPGIEKAIHSEDSLVKIFVIPTNEELMIARDTVELVNC